MLLLLTGLFGGCVNLSELKETGIKPTYYILEYEPPVTVDETTSHALRINSFTAAPLYSSTNIIYKQNAFQTGEYLYHQWHVPPAEGIAWLLARDFRQSGLCRAVFGPSSTVMTSYAIDGNVEVFLEDNSEKPWRALLSIVILLIDETEPDPGESVLLQKLYSAAEPCARNNPRATAEAMSRAMQRVSGKIVQDIYDILKERSSGP